MDINDRNNINAIFCVDSVSVFASHFNFILNIEMEYNTENRN